MIGTSTIGVAALTGSLSTDVMVAGGLILVLVFLTLYAGASQAVAIGLAALLAPVTLEYAKRSAFVSSLPHDTPGSEAVLLSVLFALLAVLTKMMSRDYLHMTSPMQAIAGGIAASCLVLLVWTSSPALSSWFQFGPTVSSIFQESFRFWWIIAMFSVFAFARM